MVTILRGYFGIEFGDALSFHRHLLLTAGRGDIVPPTVTLASLSSTCVRVYLQFLIEANVHGGSLKVKRVPPIGAGGAGAANRPMSVLQSDVVPVDANAVDSSMRVFPVNGVMVMVQHTPGCKHATLCGCVVGVLT